MMILLVALTLGQASAGQSNTDSVQQQRELILGNLLADMKAAGNYDSARYEQARQQVARLSPSEVNNLAAYYAGLKRQVMGQAVAERDQAIAVRNQLATTLAVRTAPVFSYPYPAQAAYGPAAGYPLSWAQPMQYANGALLYGFNGMFGSSMYGGFTGMGPYGTMLYGGVGPNGLPPGFGPNAVPAAFGGYPAMQATFPSAAAMFPLF